MLNSQNQPTYSIPRKSRKITILLIEKAKGSQTEKEQECNEKELRRYKRQIRR